MDAKKQIPEVSNHFKDFLDALIVSEYNGIRRKIINKCKINDQIFRNWKNGITAVPELAKPIINEIAGYEVFEILEN
ncbi:conserved hypothetical protein [uncultured Paludibacter sp.]|uniref:Uncharacterized protein n=1 Tax=uncultured Paludibacter sp. TaxID=497635 RepID=A0A653AAU7_9BACT|nr:conserved hypothetical protein [uncultured Paludibacter sp.]